MLTQQLYIYHIGVPRIAQLHVSLHRSVQLASRQTSATQERTQSAVKLVGA